MTFLFGSCFITWWTLQSPHRSTHMWCFHLLLFFVSTKFQWTFFVIFRQFFHIFRPFWPFFMIIFLYLTAEDRPENRNREIGEDMQQRTTGHNLGYCSKDLVLHEAHILPFELQRWLFFYISLSNTNITYHWPNSNMMLVLLQGEILLFDQTPVDWSNIVA